jgi:excisionase family DNA binding protein
MTVGEVTEWLRIHPTMLYRLLRKEQIPAFKVASEWRFKREAIEEWVRRREASSREADGNPGELYRYHELSLPSLVT